MHFRSAFEILNILHIIFMMKNDEEKINEINDSFRITSTESEIDTICFQSFHSKKHSKTNDCLSSFIIEFIFFSFSRSISFSIALFYDSVKQTISKDNCRAIAIIYLSHAIIVSLSLFDQCQNQETSTLNEEKWEITQIVDETRKRIINIRYAERELDCANTI